MGFYDAIRVGASGAAEAFTVDRSLRFNDDDGAYLERTPSSAGNRKKWTFSAWIKRSGLGFEQRIFGGKANASHIYLDSNDKLTWDLANEDSGTPSANLLTSQVFRDVSAWFHLVCALDTDNSTADNRMKIYFNGTEVTSFSTRSNPSSGYATNAINAASVHTIGRRLSSQGSDGMRFDGYMAEINFIDGQQYDPSYFGETNSDTGQWNPKKYTGSYGTNGYYLNFSDNSGTTATTLGKDSSGNGNNFTPSNFSVSAGNANDSVEDTPTKNWCTLNPLDPDAKTISDGNLKCVGSTGFMAGSNFVVTSGKWYMEVKYVSGTSNHQWSIGFSSPDRSYKRQVRGGDGELTPNTGTVAVTFADPDVIMVALDVDNGKWYIGKNGSYMLSGDPVNGTGFVHSGLSSSEGFMLCMINNTSDGSQTIAANFGQQGFTYTPPTGFKALNSANLPDPTILLPNKHFNTLLYTGNGAASGHQITGLNFQPDWVWIKNRGETYDHMLFDALRGVGKYLESNDTTAEATGTHLESFDSDGFTVGQGNLSNRTNANNKSYVGWSWNAGDTDGKTYTVTVVSDSGNKFRFDGFGTSAVTLDLAEGGTYIFNYPSGHPFRFSTTADGTHGGGSEYTTGVTHNSSTQVTIVVAASAPTLYYYCSSHSGMGGQINTNSTLGSSNFDGSIQTTVKVNQTAGFSIVAYEGNGSNGSTIGHGLGVTPNHVIWKNRSSAQSWMNWQTQLGDYKLSLNLSNAKVSASGNSLFTYSDFNSTTLKLGAASQTNGNNHDFIAYCFSEVAGYSKFGSYTGNGSSDGTFVFTGFRPAWVMTKRTDSGDHWNISDAKRGDFNEIDEALYANNNQAEGWNGSLDKIDYLSNGFKPRANNSQTNASGASYIYLAFAESPFKNARAR